MSTRGRVPRRDVSGRTHRSAPTRWGKISAAHKTILRGSLCHGAGQSPPPAGESEQGGLRRGEVTPPYGSNTGGAKQRADVGIGPYGETGKLHRPPGPAAHSEAYALRSRGMGGNRSRDHPQSTQQRRAIPQSRLRRASARCGAQNSLLAYAHRILTTATPFCSLLPPLAALANVPLSTREPLGTGDADRRNQRPKFWDKIWLAVATPQARRPCGPPRNDNGFLSFRGAERRGNPSFLRWTGVRAAVPRAWPPPTKFRPEIWGVGQVVGPYGSDVGRTGQFKM